MRRFCHDFPRQAGEFLTVIVPETLPSHSLLRYLARRSGLWLKTALLFEPGIVVTNVPLLPEVAGAAALHAAHPVEPERNVVLIPVSGAHDATARAVVYAKALHPSHLEGLFFASDPEEVDRIMDEWAAWRMDIPLTIVDSPFRDIKPPLLSEIRRYTGRGDTVVTVVLPEFVVRRWWEHLLHNQTALYIKRFLLFEPRVVVTSVPYRLEGGSEDGGRNGLPEVPPLAAGA